METRQSRRFGRYEIVAELGRGAVGVVYRARDPQIDRMVALKTIVLPGLDPKEEEEYRLRFLVEAQAAGRLQHPGIVSIFDVGEDPEKHDPYIVLEYVTGQSLIRYWCGRKSCRCAPPCNWRRKLPTFSTTPIRRESFTATSNLQTS